jgi:hypothetical protein
MAVTLYREVGKGKARRYQKVNLARGRRPADLSGAYFLRYSLADGTIRGNTSATTSMRQSPPGERKYAYFEALDANVKTKNEKTAIHSVAGVFVSGGRLWLRGCSRSLPLSATLTCPTSRPTVRTFRPQLTWVHKCRILSSRRSNH